VVRPRAVVFDLWETLVDWPQAESEVVRRRWSELLGITLEELDRLWYEPTAYRLRESGPLAPAVEALCAAVGTELDVEELIVLRCELTRRALSPRAGVLETLAELRDRGLRTGLITNCTEDVAEVWAESPLAASFDVCVFSSSVGCVKPDPRIYELACAELAVVPEACLFVGDGANDELGGAARAGMTPVLLHRPGEAPRWNGLSGWSGLRVTSAAEVLDLVR
jgi:putative hydrolase of the HAD superfamily